MRRAPGADDNASGTAAVLEMARVLARHHFDATIRFVAFDAEEMGEYGSEHLAGAAHKRRDAIVGMLNLDMVAFTDGGKRPLALVPDRRGEWLADRFVETAGRYGIGLRVVKRTNATWARSDQESFWAAGYPAVALLEDEPQTNPYYHRTTDTADTLDLDFLAAVTRATVAVLAELAQPQAAATRN
jgi:Zn-dependent M28 family amino/carboxypeptidase